MVTPKGDITASILIARGAPTQRDVTKTDSGGRKGRIALQNFGNSLQQCRRVMNKDQNYHGTSKREEQDVERIHERNFTSPIKKQSSGNRYYYNLHDTSHHSFNINR